MFGQGAEVAATAKRRRFAADRTRHRSMGSRLLMSGGDLAFPATLVYLHPESPTAEVECLL